MSLMYLITVSGIFGKSSKDLDILPPPLPFPDIEKAEKKSKVGRQKEKKPLISKKKEKQEKIKDEKAKKDEEKRKLAEKQKKGGLREEKKIFNFFHSLGLVKTEEEKKNIERQRIENKKLREQAKKMEEQEREKNKIEKQKQSEQREDEKRKRKEDEKKAKEEEKQKRKEKKLEDEKRKKGELELKGKGEKKVKEEEKQKLGLEKAVPKKKSFFGKIFGKKEENLELEKELKEIEEISPKRAKKEPKEKLGGELKFPELEIEREIEKPKDVIKSEEEIQKAIEGMKVKNRPSIIKGWFKKKEKIDEKIETPEVMPRTYDKIDHVYLIEEKMHKARLFLMDFKFEEAKIAYIEIMKIYGELEPKERAKVYKDIRDLYYERKSAEKFAK